VDLAKAFDRVPREAIRWVMRKLGVDKWLVSAVMSMHTDAKTVVTTVYGITTTTTTTVIWKVSVLMFMLHSAAWVNDIHTSVKAGLVVSAKATACCHPPCIYGLKLNRIEFATLLQKSIKVDRLLKS